ncbi:hypothetical protein EV421DRAFT_1366044 [Armillaria borealis]|uniref:Uncharacterized protein n=1 Tax=Armillaria borealis TaxID=47425 RepID=A0AA39J0S7_9AGAR|nr:hypothetical protein EV421DRAFT_1366044 [Armillaria borealis]
MSTLPPELVELIIYDIWHSEMPSWTCQSFMTTCPRINRTWKNVFARIASLDIYITNLGYLHYLCDIARCQKSIIYVDLVPGLTRTITCFVDFRHEIFGDNELEALKVYNCWTKLPNDIGFRALFPLAELICFELRWIGGVLLSDEPKVHELPIRLRCCRYLSKSKDNEDVRTDVHVSITDADPLSDLYRQSWPSTFLALRNRCVPAQLVSSELPCDASAKGGVLRFRQTMYVRQSKGDFEPVNQCLWMAVQRAHGFVSCYPLLLLEISSVAVVFTCSIHTLQTQASTRYLLRLLISSWSGQYTLH